MAEEQYTSRDGSSANSPGITDPHGSVPLPNIVEVGNANYATNYGSIYQNVYHISPAILTPGAANEAQTAAYPPQTGRIHATPGAPQRSQEDSSRYLERLRDHAALGALSYAAERTRAPRCHPKTRVEALRDLERWSRAEGPLKDARFLVLTGPAGHGKSAIMQTFADRLFQSRSTESQLVICTFFFLAQKPEQNQPEQFVASLAHQVASQSSAIRPFIIDAIANDTGIFATSLDHQMKHLLIQPITLATTHLDASFSLIALVDGVDECGTEENQSHVLELLHSLTCSSIPHARVAVASRREFPVRDALEKRWKDVHHVELERIYDASNDVEVFLSTRLADVWERLLKHDSRGASWPTPEHIWELCYYSSGQFVLADIAVRYVDDRRLPGPRARLEEVLQWCRNDRSTRGSSSPLNALDKLFAKILQKAAYTVYPDDPDGYFTLASLLWILKHEVHWPTDLPVWVFEGFMLQKPGSLRLQLAELQSLITVEVPLYRASYCQHFGVYHKSFNDFLESAHSGIPQRASAWFSRVCTAHAIRATPAGFKDMLKGLAGGGSAMEFLQSWLFEMYHSSRIQDFLTHDFWQEFILSLNSWEHFSLKRRLFYANCVRNPHDEEDDLPWPHGIHILPHGCRVLQDIDVELLVARAEWVKTIRPCPTTNEDSVWEPVSLRGHYFLDSAFDVLAENVLANLRALWYRKSGYVRLRSSELRSSVQVEFIVGSPSSGKRRLLRAAWEESTVWDFSDDRERSFIGSKLLSVKMHADGQCLSVWSYPALSKGSTRHYYNAQLHQLLPTLNIAQLMEDGQGKTFLYLANRWRSITHRRSDEKPMFVVQNFHLLFPENQAIFLNALSEEINLVRRQKKHKLYITIVSCPTLPLANHLRNVCARDIFYLNLDTLSANPSLRLLEDSLYDGLVRLRCIHPSSGPLLSAANVPQPDELRALAGILSRSSRVWHHIKKLLNYTYAQDQTYWRTLLSHSPDEALQAIERLPYEHIREHDCDCSDCRDSWRLHVPRLAMDSSDEELEVGNESEVGTVSSEEESEAWIGSSEEESEAGIGSSEESEAGINSLEEGLSGAEDDGDVDA